MVLDLLKSDLQSNRYDTRFIILIIIAILFVIVLLSTLLAGFIDLRVNAFSKYADLMKLNGMITNYRLHKKTKKNKN